MKCFICKEDINKKGQDNMSPFSGFPVCEDCSNELTEKEWEEIKRKYEEDSDR